MNPKDKPADQEPSGGALSSSASPKGEGSGPESKSAPKRSQKGKKVSPLRKMREDRLLTKAELARRANLSVLTIDRVEKGFGCRMDTKRKILEALGLGPADRLQVFDEED